jgi:molybdate transport system substrate-binding protein
MNTVISGISSMATRLLLNELSRAHAPGGIELRFESTGGVEAARRVAAGEAFDLVVLAAETMNKLAAAGHVLGDSLIAIADSPMAIAAQQGEPGPAVDSEDALREAVLGARCIGYSTGPSGVALMALFARWRLADTLAGRLSQARPGVPVGTLIADGSCDIGFQQLSELQHVEGVVVLGTMPPGLEIVTTFTGAVGARSAHVAQARQVLRYLGSGEAAATKRRHGLLPAG